MSKDKPGLRMKHGVCNSADCKRLYDYIYRSGPTAGIWSYGRGDKDRDGSLLQHLLKHLPINGQTPPRVLDASCGRGNLALLMKSAGYEVEVTEISEYLVKEELPKRLPGVPIHLLAYDELDRLPAKSFDAVISNDVLEHLPDVTFVENAFENFVRLSRQYVLFSAAGVKKVRAHIRMLHIDGVESLHTCVMPADQWVETANKYLDPICPITSVAPRTIRYCGKVKS